MSHSAESQSVPRVLIDATPLLGQRTGIGRYTEHLLAALAMRHDLSVTATAFTVRGSGRLRNAVPPGVDVRFRPFPARVARIAWRHFDLPRSEWLAGRADIVHGTNFVLPPSHRGAGVVSIHDLTLAHTRQHHARGEPGSQGPGSRGHCAGPRRCALWLKSLGSVLPEISTFRWSEFLLRHPGVGSGLVSSVAIDRCHTDPIRPAIAVLCLRRNQRAEKRARYFADRIPDPQAEIRRRLSRSAADWSKGLGHRPCVGRHPRCPACRVSLAGSLAFCCGRFGRTRVAQPGRGVRDARGRGTRDGRARGDHGHPRPGRGNRPRCSALPGWRCGRTCRKSATEFSTIVRPRSPKGSPGRGGSPGRHAPRPRWPPITPR